MKANFLDIWHGDLLSEQSDQRLYWSLLNEDERERAGKFVRQDLQQKYIKTRAELRKTLASYLNIEPQKLMIKTGRHGKPFLAEGSVYFNLSHTTDKFVLAVSNIDDLGVDVERYRKRTNLAGLVDKCFSAEESLYWHAMPDVQKIAAFYRFWVRKEAFVKAVGRGIALGLAQCVINPQDQSRFLTIPEDYGLASDWKILDIPLSENEQCAVVTKNRVFEYKQMALK